jgi:hypothetical protein
MHGVPQGLAGRDPGCVRSMGARAAAGTVIQRHWFWSVFWKTYLPGGVGGAAFAVGRWQELQHRCQVCGLAVTYALGHPWVLRF